MNTSLYQLSIGKLCHTSVGIFYTIMNIFECMQNPQAFGFLCVTYLLSNTQVSNAYWVSYKCQMPIECHTSVTCLLSVIKVSNVYWVSHAYWVSYKCHMPIECHTSVTCILSVIQVSQAYWASHKCHVYWVSQSAKCHQVSYKRHHWMSGAYICNLEPHYRVSENNLFPLSNMTL